MLKIDISVDRENHLAYVKFNSGESTNSIEVTESISVDMTPEGKIFGVEFLSFNNLHLQESELTNNFGITDQEIVKAILEAQSMLLKELSSK